ncbi:hypothetical protein B7P43_G18029 [Cryptotermes secundus]|uniref:Uncharacterized protein n=1 Tax=Cryptotermes secundus TaxID=105785 RepID=A0A2J7QR20_9NEOP|nr:hypothetical protein B7P43_G18029 [Cryptotermes secundus]
MTYACPLWKFAADTYLLKLQHMQNKILLTIGNFPRFTPIRNLHTAFNLSCVYDYITKFCRQQVEVVPYHENEHVSSIEQGENRCRTYKRLKLGSGPAYN